MAQKKAGTEGDVNKSALDVIPKQANSQLVNKAKTGGQVIIDSLIKNDINRAFCVPGESYLGILQAADEYKKHFDLVVCRHEGGASYMAEAHGRVTGRPGVCMVTRSPGASNAMIGVTTAMQESTPMLLIMGHVSMGTQGRFAFQEMDSRSVFSSVAKWVGVVERAADIPHLINRALRIAVSGRPGPVVLAVPDSVQLETIIDYMPIRAEPQIMAPTTASIERIQELLADSRKPLVIVGGTGWKQTDCDNLSKFITTFDLPVSTTFRRNDLMNNDDPHYIGAFGPGGYPGTVNYLKDSDLVLLFGGRLGEIETRGYTHLSKSSAERKFVHAAPLSDEFGEVLEPDLAITTGIGPLCEMLAGLEGPAEKPWTDKRKALRQSFESFYEPVDFGEKLNPAWAVIELQKVLPDDSILTSGAGTYTHFFLRHYRFRILGTLFAPLSAPMGYSVPAAISIAMEKPESEIVSFVGDGCFLMNPQELVVAAKRNLRITVVMFNNEMYGSVRMHEEMSRPGMSVGTALDNPDFQALAGAFGLKSRRVVKPEDVAAVYVELRQETSGPIFIELMTDKDVITPHKTISQLRGVKK